jgi:hypothetical protein
MQIYVNNNIKKFKEHVKNKYVNDENKDPLKNNMINNSSVNYLKKIQDIDLNLTNNDSNKIIINEPHQINQEDIMSKLNNMKERLHNLKKDSNKYKNIDEN